jgi:peptide/nickel transport system permease protein
VTALFAGRMASEAIAGRSAARPLRRLVAHRGGQLGLGIAGLLAVAALAGPVVARDPNATHYAQQLLAPSLHHWLGTDADGRDELARTVAGTRTTLGATLLIFTLTTTVGLLVGGLSGYLGGVIDAVVSRIIDVLLGLPSMIIALAVVGALGVGYWNLVIAISFTGWAYIGRMARSHVLGSRSRLDVTAARLAGVGRLRTFTGHVLPAALANVGVAAASTMGDTILVLAGLSFLGLGAQPPVAELGQMLSDSRGDLASSPWLAIGPTVVLVLAVAAAALISDALRDVTDVKAAGRRTSSGRARDRRVGRDRTDAGRTGRSDRPGRPPVSEVPALAVIDLEVMYPDGNVAVRGVNITVGENECVAVVGESGCGKTTLARCILQLLPPGTTAQGSLQVAGVDVLAVGESRLRDLRGMAVGYVGQDPYAACDPLQAVSRHVEEPWRAHRMKVPSGESARRVEALGVRGASERLWQRPHQWSGGMLQRATIAAANAHHPILTIADEPTSALDAELADDVLDVIRAASGSVLLISHDLRLVDEHSDRVVVLYAGRVVESGPTRQLIARPRHPYTRALLDASPRPGGGPVHALPGAPPSPSQLPAGCAFAARCPRVLPMCHSEQPELVDGVACWAVHSE